jgi:asparagine synthase (glutamine-hydrolysing)
VHENYALMAEIAGAGPRDVLASTGAYMAGPEAYALTGGDFARSMMLADLGNYMVDDCLVKVDRATMACSIEDRVPLLDEAVLETSLRMPLEYKWRRGKGKHLLRKILYRRVPRELVDRPKMGFGIPLDRWLFNEMREFTMDLLSRDTLIAVGLEPEGVRRIVDAHQRGRADYQYFLWPLCSYVNWFLLNREDLTVNAQSDAKVPAESVRDEPRTSLTKAAPCA